MTDEPINTGWTKLYHPTGALVTIPLSTAEPITVDQARIFITSVDNLVAAGFTPNMPGLEEGELMEEISAVARREAADLTPIIDFYSSNTRLEKKFLHAYLNTQEDIEAFEQASGLKLDFLTTYDGKIAIERTDRNAPKYIKQLPSPIKTVYKISPKWEQWKAAGGEGQEPHKRLLVRYELGRKSTVTDPGKPEQPEETQGSGPKQYDKLGGELVTMLVRKLNVKPSVITAVLAKVPSKTISFESALKLVEDNLANVNP